MTRNTPSIRISQHSGQRSSSDFHDAPPGVASIALPMAIPRAREAVPPPLPPPQYIPEISPGRDPGWQWANDPSASDFARPASVRPGSSLLGGFHKSTSQERNTDGRVDDYARRTSSTSTITPPRDVEMANSQSGEESNSRPQSDYRLQSERRLERPLFEGSSHAYDKQMLGRIGGPNTPSKSLSGSSVQDAAMSDRERRNSLLPALGQSQDSTRWLPSMSSSGAISPHVWEGSHTRHNSVQSERFYEANTQDDFPMDDAQPAREDVFGNFKIGAKRRASSPPRDLQQREDRHSLGSASHLSESQRRANQQLSRDGPPPRFHPNHASVSSVSSYGGQRHGSLGSSLGIASVTSSATSFASGVVSPLAASAMDAEGSIQSLSSHQRTASESTQTDKRSPDHSHSRQGSRSQTGLFVCECCPRKFKKFDTEEQLRAHESEKQYGCLYCSNRFKNKNEAERHQNSLHLRRHSWSCAALAGYEAAFHPAKSANDADTCGYCGEEFTKPADWKDRIQHLQNNHKFGQCNQTKKFFRADHFRQHLKHSHDGTSGKWTNELENACMKDEPPPAKLADAVPPFTPTNEYPNQRA
ncbi:hypothetical protein AMS68_002988 [Peltaster fructicola]|uniref:C2H2-type domain-containing protein n=1 Tax=Peltaster fructicola TaxID=286661 RepID=A0A6H0XS38_9PEZI|nr:hypothetical protein AMS68_002988 [Peltaster fructicola]